MLHHLTVARKASRAACPLAVLLACLAIPVAAAEPVRTRDAAMAALLDKLQAPEQDMPDVALLVLDRVAADPDVGAELKQEIPFRRAKALVAKTRTEADAKKQASLLDEAEREMDRFLGTSPAGRRAIEAYSQKGNLLLQRGRALVLQANRPGADANRLRADALPFFDGAIKALQGTEKPGQASDKATNAEDAAIKALAAVEAEIKVLNDAMGDDGKEGEKRSKPKSPKRDAGKQLQQLEDEQEALNGQLLIIRFLVAEAFFEKATAYPPGSAERRAAVEQSAALYKSLAAKYPNSKAAILAQYHEGRNYADLEKWDLAASTLAGVYGIDDPQIADWRAKALALMLDRWLVEKKFDQLDDKLLKFVNTPTRDPRKLDAGWLAAKYRAAAFLDGKAEALPASDKAKKSPLQTNARKLAVEVAMANKDFAKEARELAAKLGRDVPDGEPTERTFKTMVDEARLGSETMRAKQAEAKDLEAAGKTDEAAAASGAAAAARDAAIKLYEEAVKAGVEKKEDDNAVASAIADLTRLLYDAKRFREAAERGDALVKENPDSAGSGYAARVALASWQQLSKAADAGDAKERMLSLANFMVKKWPSDPAGDDALAMIVGTAIETRNPDEIAAAVKALPADSPKRPELLQRIGSALWREVQEKRREEGLGPEDLQKVAGWKAQATAALDQGLAAAAGDPTRPAVSAALSRLQMAIEDGDAKLAGDIIDNPAYGPWAAVQGGGADFSQGPLAESSLTASLRYFIQTQQLDKAQQAMERLEKTAGDPNRLTALYLQMGRDLQGQLEALAANAGQPEVRDRAAKVLDGFESFLEKLAARDDRVSSQMWVATTYASLGSGKGTGAVVSKEKAQGFLDRAAAAFDRLLGKGGDEIAKYEPSIRLRLAGIYRERGKFDEAQKQIDGILADPKRQALLDVQVQAAELLQAAGMAAAAADADKADRLLGQAIVGRKEGGSVWGWGGISKKLAAKLEPGSRTAEQYLEARLNISKCMLVRAQLPGKAAADKAKLLAEAKRAISFTRQVQPKLGGESFSKRFEKLLKDIQKAEGVPETGFRELDEKEQASKPVPAEVGK
jgi:hypothetical protein